MNRYFYTLRLLLLCLGHFSLFGQVDSILVLKKTIFGNISPKSIVHNGSGKFFAQNMIYNHTVTVYDRNYTLVKTIRDQIIPSDFGMENREGVLKGAPVEAAFTHQGKYVWVTNYRMYGKGYNIPTYDTCDSKDTCSNSFIYKINTETFAIERIIETGCVPKYICGAGDKYLIVSNWCSGSIDIFDLASESKLKSIAVGSHPRGICIDAQTRNAYVAIMGSNYLAKIDLQSLTIVQRIPVGATPRHVVMDKEGQFLYVSLNSRNEVIKYNISTEVIENRITPGKAPRSMVLDDNNRYLYVVNYISNTISKIRVADFKLIQSVKTNYHPIGITYDEKMDEVWVACYSGSIMVFSNKARSKSIASLLGKKGALKYYIVAGSFENENNAELLVEDLRQIGYNPLLKFSENNMMRVCYEQIDDLPNALLALNKYRKINRGAWILKE